MPRSLTAVLVATYRGRSRRRAVIFTVVLAVNLIVQSPVLTAPKH